MYEGDIAQLYIPPLTRSLRMTTDSENGNTFNQYTYFGLGTVSCQVDLLQPEYGTYSTWLVAYPPGTPAKSGYYDLPNPDLAADAARAAADVPHARLMFLFSKDDVQLLPVSLAGYIMQGIECGFVGPWPLVCWDGRSGWEADKVQKALARLRSGR